MKDLLVSIGPLCPQQEDSLHCLFKKQNRPRERGTASLIGWGKLNQNTLKYCYLSKSPHGESSQNDRIACCSSSDNHLGRIAENLRSKRRFYPSLIGAVTYRSEPQLSLPSKRAGDREIAIQCAGEPDAAPVNEPFRFARENRTNRSNRTRCYRRIHANAAHTGKGHHFADTGTSGAPGATPQNNRKLLSLRFSNGGMDETRTRDRLRDRQTI